MGGGEEMEVSAIEDTEGADGGSEEGTKRERPKKGRKNIKEGKNTQRDTSHVCQAYDQQVEKYDKTHIRAALNMLNPVLGQSMDQCYLIAIAINDQHCIKKESWIDSFKNVNMHPHTRSNFDVWIRKLDDSGFISAEKFFENRTTLYDAMPA